VLKWIAVTLMMLVAVVPSRGEPPKFEPYVASVVIRNNPGGMIGDFLTFRWFLDHYNVLVIFDGSCVSACTLLLSLPPEQICVTRRATFSFHRARHQDMRVEDAATDAVFKMYPQWVQKFILDNGGLRRDFIQMSAAYAHAHLRECRG
jgi:hypothetical protein